MDLLRRRVGNMPDKNILGDLIECPHCRKNMKLKKNSFRGDGCIVICDDCAFEREVRFPPNTGGYIGELE